MITKAKLGGVEGKIKNIRSIIDQNRRQKVREDSADVKNKSLLGSALEQSSLLSQAVLLNKSSIGKLAFFK